MTEVSLYYAPDNASLIVRIVLEELGLPYESILVDRSTGAQRSEAFLKLNPSGLIPVCIIDGEVITETAAILLALTELTGSSLTVHNNDSNRAVFLRWLFFLSNTLHAELRHLFYPEKYVGPDQRTDYRDRTRARISGHLKILEDQYQQGSHRYLLGENPTVIDIYLAVCLRWLQLYPLADRGWFIVTAYPSLFAMIEWLQQREAVINACQFDGITGKFFTESSDARPREGSAL